MENENDPLVSIGIPTYRRPAELRETLIQILSQTYKNLDVIISDNGTEGDEVTEVVQQFMNVDNRIRFFRQEKNIGPIKNFQFVLDQAIGKYFMWCADDDWHAPQFVEHLVREMVRVPIASLAFCNFKAIDLHGNEWGDASVFSRPLQLFTTPNTKSRLWLYFMQPEWEGKGNLFYGLMNREVLRECSWTSFVNSYGFAFVDNLFVFSLLKKGPLVLAKGTLYGACVGNEKHHSESMTSIFGLIQKAKNWTRYVFGYSRMVTGSTRVIYFGGAIWKTALFIKHVLQSRIKRITS
jgi:glycosyltransferase involved in cell wall biosynthesis